MKLILCSISDEHIFGKIKPFLYKPMEEIKVLVIPCALPVSVRERKIIKNTAKLGFSEENITVFKADTPDLFKNLDIDLVYTLGGNTFLLLSLLRRCGFDKEIAAYIEKGIPYIGASAGAHLVTKDTRHLIPIDGTPDTLKNFDDFSALGFLDGILFCHFGPDRQKYYEKAIADNKFKVYTLTDREILVIENNNIAKY